MLKKWLKMCITFDILMDRNGIGFVASEKLDRKEEVAGNKKNKF